MATQRDKNVRVLVAPRTDAEAGQPSSSRLQEADLVTQNEERDLSRGLHQRHISLIAIAGAIVSVSINVCTLNNSC